jgi:hypothetical protein
MQFKKYLSFLLVALVLTATALPSQAAKAPTSSGAGLTVPVQGTANSAGRVTGTFTIQRFVDNGGQLGAFGTLVLSTPNGTAISQVVMPVAATHRPAAATTASAVAIQAVCEIVDLTLGPLDLNLLGLEIHLDTVHLDIDANPAGGLLGQLLSGLLCGTDLGGIFGNLTTLVAFLNSLLQALGGILGGI